MATSDYTIKDLEKKKFVVNEDGISVRTSVSPAPVSGSGSTSGYALLDLEYQKFIETPDGIAVRFTNVGAWPVLETWEAGKSYKAGEMVNSGSDGNWLFKVIVDHVSLDVPLDVKDGKLLPLSPPTIASGVQGGGAATLNGSTITVAAGTGFIAKYNTSPSPYPLITIVEWQEQSKLLPFGIHSIYIDQDGILQSSLGFIDSETASNNIGIAIVDLNLGKVFEAKTYPTNPVGQLRSLSFFFGGLTKGLKYTATGLQLSRSAYQTYIWGTDNTDPYDPNTKDHAATSPVAFFEYTQTGAVIPVVAQTTLKNNVYDLNGTLTVMSNNKWGFIRIYTSLADEDYIMYAQSEYPTEQEAKDAAISSSFIKPVDLTLTKFSAWFVFEKGDLTFNNNEITVCEPFGCDKMGSSGGGAAAGAGDVVGPPSSTDSGIARFNGTTGKILKDSPAIALTDSGQLNIDNRILFGANVVGRENNAGTMGYNQFGLGDNDTGILTIVGGGTTNGNRSVRIYERLGVGKNPIQPLDVQGNILSSGNVSANTITAGTNITANNLTVSAINTHVQISGAPNTPCLTLQVPQQVVGTSGAQLIWKFGNHSPAFITTVYDDTNSDGNAKLEFWSKAGGYSNRLNLSLHYLNANFSGRVASPGFDQVSDAGLKKDISTLAPEELINFQILKPIKYKWIDDQKEKNHFGFVAQDIQRIYPGMVGESSLDGDATLRYSVTDLLALAVAKIQELEKRIELLEQK